MERSSNADKHNTNEEFSSPRTSEMKEISVELDPLDGCSSTILVFEGEMI